MVIVPLIVIAAQRIATQANAKLVQTVVLLLVDIVLVVEPHKVFANFYERAIFADTIGAAEVGHGQLLDELGVGLIAGGDRKQPPIFQIFQAQGVGVPRAATRFTKVHFQELGEMSVPCPANRRRTSRDCPPP